MATNAQTTAARLSRELGGSFHVVAHPDHPMLLSGPDILIGGEGKLTALVFVGRYESQNTVLARITAIRLALPPTTRLLAVLNKNSTLHDRVIENFDEVADQDASWRAITRFATGDSRPRGDQSALTENKRRHSEKFAFALLLATLRRRHSLESIAPEAVIRELAQVEQGGSGHAASVNERRRPTTQIQGSLVTSFSSPTRVVQQLRSLCESGFIHSYQLDTGVPYERQEANLNFLLIEDWPTVRHDPEKPVRSAAFGCWVMAKSSSADDIFRLIRRTRDKKYVRKWRYA